jgi:hypothetical protein
MSNTAARFPLGRVYATRNAHEAVPHLEMWLAITRHVSGDWGDVCPEDWKSNDDALIVGNRLLSSYKTEAGTKFWIITEWDRSMTTVLLPEDY